MFLTLFKEVSLSLAKSGRCVGVISRIHFFWWLFTLSQNEKSCQEFFSSSRSWGSLLRTDWLIFNFRSTFGQNSFSWVSIFQLGRWFFSDESGVTKKRFCSGGKFFFRWKTDFLGFSCYLRINNETSKSFLSSRRLDFDLVSILYLSSFSTICQNNQSFSLSLFRMILLFKWRKKTATLTSLTTTLTTLTTMTTDVRLICWQVFSQNVNYFFLQVFSSCDQRWWMWSVQPHVASDAWCWILLLCYSNLGQTRWFKISAKTSMVPWLLLISQLWSLQQNRIFGYGCNSTCTSGGHAGLMGSQQPRFWYLGGSVLNWRYTVATGSKLPKARSLSLGWVFKFWTRSFGSE